MGRAGAVRHPAHPPRGAHRGQPHRAPLPLAATPTTGASTRTRGRKMGFDIAGDAGRPALRRPSSCSARAAARADGGARRAPTPPSSRASTAHGRGSRPLPQPPGRGCPGQADRVGHRPPAAQPDERPGQVSSPHPGAARLQRHLPGEEPGGGLGPGQVPHPLGRPVRLHGQGAGARLHPQALQHRPRDAQAPRVPGLQQGGSTASSPSPSAPATTRPSPPWRSTPPTPALGKISADAAIVDAVQEAQNALDEGWKTWRA